MNARPTISVVIADDHAAYREGLKVFLQPLKKEGITVTGEAANGREAVSLAARLQPDVILMDVQMPEVDGVKATALIKEAQPAIGIIAVSFSCDYDTVIRMAEAGADGYLPKTVEGSELATAIKTVCTGQTYFASVAGAHLVAKLKADRRCKASGEKELTKRENEVAKMECDGAATKEIAAALHIGIRTVDTYRKNIRRKTGTKNPLQLLRYAARHRLFES